MHSDLFSSFDIAWGGGGYVFWLCSWFSCFIAIFFYLVFMVYFYKFSWWESLLLEVSEGLEKVMSTEKVKVFTGSTHVFVCLFMFLVSMNISGLLPFIYPLTFHLIVTSSFSVPFWLMSVLVNFNFNWKLFFITQIESSEGKVFMTYVISLMMVVSETISILVRPITLSARLSMNMFIGQMIMKVLTSVSVGIFYPFTYFGGVTFSLVMLSLSGFYFIVEVCMSILQAIIFTGLCVFYVSEVKLKVD
uniref:ATP synthase subunit a n=1 Tax=Corbicula fluminea TaxID=45949 RepID=A0A8E5JSK5_CORFM|nr:ATP synthase F0 subunit 6 [Corbicula sandai]QVD39153.1 ATP synthase F0 subunit 6 [Corbicula fluminea]QYH50561.1 ATP synthase F0 subunit 6 [Corbicula sp. QL-2021]WNS59837.1 ATP synthase F0 subunit 6 [Corbicula fluminea]BCT98254.1 ATP synthase F0 subunit 6 [Corbicula sandai]